MSFNLVRNSRLFFTTNVDATTGAIPTSGATVSNTNTFEIQVLDGFSFSQGTQQTTIQINEAGSTPVRGQRAFNTTLDPVDITFSTYIRPKLVSTLVEAEESYLWNALLSDTAIGSSAVALGGTVTLATSYSAGVGELTISGTGMTFAGVVVGGTYIMSGFTGATAADFNTAVTVKTLTATSIVLTYLDAPTSAAPNATTAVTFNSSAWTKNIAAAPTAAFSQVSSALSNKNQLQKFGLVFLVDNAVYAIDNCVVDSASIDFSIEGIAMVAWSIKGTKLRYLASATIIGAPAVFGGTGIATGTAANKTTDAKYITNKLSTMQLKSNIGGTGGTTYTIALTGGNLTISNNVSYVTPSNLGVVNEAIGYFTGSRSISGNVTAYLRIGSGLSAQLLSDILTANASETKFWIQVEVGGLANAVRVEFQVPGAVLQVPTVETADVVTTTINFTAQGHSNIAGATATYDVSQTNDLRVRYFST